MVGGLFPHGYFALLKISRSHLSPIHFLWGCNISQGGFHLPMCGGRGSLSFLWQSTLIGYTIRFSSLATCYRMLRHGWLSVTTLLLHYHLIYWKGGCECNTHFIFVVLVYLRGRTRCITECSQFLVYSQNKEACLENGKATYFKYCQKDKEGLRKEGGL